MFGAKAISMENVIAEQDRITLRINTSGLAFVNSSPRNKIRKAQFNYHTDCLKASRKYTRTPEARNSPAISSDGGPVSRFLKEKTGRANVDMDAVTKENAYLEEEIAQMQFKLKDVRTGGPAVVVSLVLLVCCVRGVVSACVFVLYVEEF